MNVQYNESEWEKKLISVNYLSSGGADEAGKSLIRYLNDAQEVLEKADENIKNYDKDNEIELSYSNQKWKYEEFSGKIELFKMMIGKVPNEIFSVDQLFNAGMDHFAEDLSNFDINGQSTTSRVAIPNPNYSVDGMDRDPMLQKVTLSDLLYPKSPLTQYFKEEYAKIKELGYDVSYEDYQELCFASTAFEYYSIGEENRDLAVNIIVNGAMLAVGASLPWKIAAAWGLVSGVKNGTEAAVGKDAITGKDLSPQERIARGLFGALDVGLAGYAGAKGFKNWVKTPKKASGAKSSGEDIFNYTNKVNEHMANPDRAVPAQTLKEAIKGGTPMPDPRGSSATMYYSEIYINGKKYNFEVLYDKATNTIYHYKYDRRPLGPLPAVPKQ